MSFVFNIVVVPEKKIYYLQYQNNNYVSSSQSICGIDFLHRTDGSNQNNLTYVQKKKGQTRN